MAPFTVLPDALEDELHGQRLLRVEERPFERIKSRLLGQTTPFSTYLTRKTEGSLTDANDDQDSKENRAEEFNPEEHAKFVKDLKRFRDDVILDFAAFEASIARIQFLRDANIRERQRYTAEKLRIEATAQEVREDTARLKIRLEEAKKTLEIRKAYDVLAETITKDARLQPRDEQDANIERLRSEIEELKNESSELENAWLDRRSQFARVLDEGRRLRRIVRDEKEPDHEDKADDEREDDGSDSDGDENMLGVERQRDDGTPRPGGDDAPTPLPDVEGSGAMTPRSEYTADQEKNLGHIPDAEGAAGEDAMGDRDTEHNQGVPIVRIDDEMDVS